jgi:multiple sugar transport system substrate-binding protein
MRSDLIITLPLLIFFLSLGCGNSQPSDKNILRYSFWGGYLELSMWDELKRNFEAANPDVFVKLEYAPGSDNPASLVTRMLARSAADCMMIDDDGLPWLASKGYLEPLDEYLTRDGVDLKIEEFLPTSRESAQYEGKYWALPWDGFCEIIYANLDLFAAAGIPEPTKDWTWDDFARIAARLTRDNNGDGIKDQYGLFLPMNSQHNQKIFWSYGASYMNPEKTRITIGSPGTVQGLELYADLLFRKKCVAFLNEIGSMAEEVMLVTKRVGMVACPAYVMINLRQLPDWKWDVFHIPRGPAGRAGRVSWDCIGIFRQAPPEKKALAWRWIKHVLSSESQRIIGKSGRAMPVRPEDVRASFIRADTPQHEERFLEAMLEYGCVTPHMLASKSWRSEADFIMGRFGTVQTNDWGHALAQGEDPPDPTRHRVNPERWLSPQVTADLLQKRCQTVVDEFTKRGY